MKIYSTRHGETKWNVENRIVGTTDLTLTENGVEQAKKLAKMIKKNCNIDQIIASPMLRAMQTAQIISDEIDVQIIFDERLREWDYGDYEGMNRHTEGFYENKREFGVKMGEKGESLLQLTHRVYSFLDEIIKKYKDKNVLIVSHGGVCRAIETYFNDMTTEEFSSWFAGNCELLEYNIE